MAEPNPGAVFCRRGIDGEWPEYGSLGEIRERMDRVEPKLIGAIARQQIQLNLFVNSRNELPFSVFAKQQKENILRVREVAGTLNPGLDGFEDMVEWVHRAMYPPGRSLSYSFWHDPGIELRILSALAERSHYVRQATFFKRDLDESSAPARQARNIANAREIAGGFSDQIDGFEDFIEGVYGVLVPASVALQHRFWRQTVAQRSGHQAQKVTEVMTRQPEIWNLGEFDNRAHLAVA